MVRRYWPAAVIAVGLLLIAYGGFLYLGKSPARARTSLPAPIQIISPLPYVSPSPGANRIKIDELHVDLPVVPGDGHNAPLFMAAVVPTLKWPGEGGRSMVYAHARDGMFGPLFHAAVGQHVEWTQTDGTVLHYIAKQVFLRWPATDTVWLQPADHEQMILETCTTYNANDPRIIVVTEPG